MDRLCFFVRMAGFRCTSLAAPAITAPRLSRLAFVQTPLREPQLRCPALTVLTVDRCGRSMPSKLTRSCHVASELGTVHRGSRRAFIHNGSELGIALPPFCLRKFYLMKEGGDR